eukprot:scaffold2724_cov260-Pinguiococcus_pyrenoidosus.AAC.18
MRRKEEGSAVLPSLLEYEVNRMLLRRGVLQHSASAVTVSWQGRSRRATTEPPSLLVCVFSSSSVPCSLRPFFPLSLGPVDPSSHAPFHPEGNQRALVLSPLILRSIHEDTAQLLELLGVQPSVRPRCWSRGSWFLRLFTAEVGRSPLHKMTSGAVSVPSLKWQGHQDPLSFQSPFRNGQSPGGAPDERRPWGGRNPVLSTPGPSASTMRLAYHVELLR